MKLIKWLIGQPYRLSREEVAEYIDNFLQNRGGDYDWDDFTSIPLDYDPYLEGIRLKCGAVRDEYPPPPGVAAYCNEQGMQVLREMLDELRAGPIDQCDTTQS